MHIVHYAILVFVTGLACFSPVWLSAPLYILTGGLCVYWSLPQSSLVRLSKKIGMITFKDNRRTYQLHVPLRPVERRHRAFMQDGTEIYSHPLVPYWVSGKDLGPVTIDYLGDERLCTEEIVVD